MTDYDSLLKYAAWIVEHYPDGGYGQCAAATQKMVAEFPELRRVRGHYYDDTWGKRAHWWCETKDGEIVDPTFGQFPSRGLGEYEEWDDSQIEPTGKCMNCGELCYEGSSFCQASCSSDFSAHLLSRDPL